MLEASVVLVCVVTCQSKPSPASRLAPNTFVSQSGMQGCLVKGRKNIFWGEPFKTPYFRSSYSLKPLLLMTQKNLVTR